MFKIVRTRFFPLKGYILNLFGVLFIRGDREVNDKILNHEAIHSAQMKELLYIPFYVWYVVEWLARLPFGNAYTNISFEREAFINDDNLNYLFNRPRWAFLKYL